MTVINLNRIRQQLHDRIAEGHLILTSDDAARLGLEFALSFAADPHLQSVSQLVQAAEALGYHGEHRTAEQEQALEDALLAVLAPHFAPPLERIMDALPNCSEFKLTCPDLFGEWTAEFAYERCHFQGQGETPEAALLEAMVERQIADHYYAGGEQLTPEQMTEWLHGAYRAHLGLTPEHEYRGEYLRAQAAPTAPPAAASDVAQGDSLLETVSAAVHDEWVRMKQTAGVVSRKAEDGEELMVPYAQLSDAAKELDRATVRAVMRQLPSQSPRPLALSDLPAEINALLRRADSPFVLGDLTRKRPGGGEWRGVVVGLYLASKTPLGFAVESVREEGSVQIYPARALEGWDGQDGQD